MLNAHTDWDHTLLLTPFLKCGVDYMINAMVKITYPCNHIPLPRKPSMIYHILGKTLDLEVNQREFEDALKVYKTSMAEYNTKKSEIEHTLKSTNVNEIKDSVCPSCTIRRKDHEIYLIKRLFKLVSEMKFELRDSISTRVKMLPDEENQRFWAMTSEINKQDFITFCNAERIGVIFEGESIDIEKPNENTTIKQPTASSMELNPQENKPNDAPPCITDHMIAITKLAITAAWELECETGSRASAEKVIDRLGLWVDAKKNTALVSKSIHAVNWVTLNGKEKNYDMLACRKTLLEWHKKRAVLETGEPK